MKHIFVKQCILGVFHVISAHSKFDVFRPLIWLPHRGFTGQPENSKRAHLRIPGFQSHHEVVARKRKCRP